MSNNREKKINLRLDSNTLRTIDRAAQIEGKNRTQFMADCARKEAEQVLKDRVIYYLDEEDWKYINDPNPEPDPKIRAILNRKPLWNA